jgi:threonine dehydratase
METALDRDTVREVHRRIAPFVRRTPVVETASRDFGLAGDYPITFKLELLQHAGAFKTRGAFANLLLRPVPAAGVAAASGGNHGAAVAYAAHVRGVPAHIFVPTVASPAKQARIRSYGAQLEVGGALYADALAACDAWVAAHEALAVHAFDDAETLLGQATLAKEWEEQASDLETVLVAVGGGGLIGGVAGWFAGRVRVVGVEPQTAPTLFEALRAGEPVDAPAGGIAADSLAPRRVGARMFPIARAHVEQVVLVRDATIARAQELLWDRLRIVAEPGGATAFAGLLEGAYVPAPGERVGVIVSGGNTTAVDWSAARPH